MSFFIENCIKYINNHCDSSFQKLAVAQNLEFAIVNGFLIKIKKSSDFVEILKLSNSLSIAISCKTKELLYGILKNYPEINEENISLVKNYIKTYEKVSNIESKEEVLSEHFEFKKGKEISKGDNLYYKESENTNLDKLNLIGILIEKKDYDRVQGMLKKGDININCIDSDGYTPLVRSIYINDLKMVNLLLSYGADVNYKDKTTQTPLMRAAKSTNVFILLAILNSGANLLLTDKNKKTALDFAIKANNTNAVAILKKYQLKK